MDGMCGGGNVQDVAMVSSILFILFHNELIRFFRILLQHFSQFMAEPETLKSEVYSSSSEPFCKSLFAVNCVIISL